MQQIRVKVSDDALSPLEYLFDSDRAIWRPSLDNEELDPGVSMDAATQEFVLPRPKEGWYRVNDLVRLREGEQIVARDHMALTEMSPESGNYILMSLRCRGRKGVQAKD